MIGDRCDKTFALVVGGVDIIVRRQRVALQCLVYTLCNSVHRVACQPFELCTLRVVGLIVQSGQSGSQTFQILIRQIAMSDALKQLLQCQPDDIGTIAWSGNRLRALGDTHSIDKEKVILAEGIGSHCSKLFVTNGAHAASLHLNVKRFGLHVTHEHHHFEWFHVGTRSHQRASDGDTEVAVVAELADEFIAVARRIGNLLYISVHIGIGTLLSKYLFGYVHDIGGMHLVERKNKRLGKIGKVWLTLWVIEHFRIHGIAICGKNEFYLRGIDYRAV